MAFDGNEGEPISLQTAAGWTAKYRATMGANDPKGHFFGRNEINSILAQTGCKGIRIYYGINDLNEKVLILVGADANENDMTNLIVDKSVLCPPRCGARNSLNG